ncbi:hypothetical protein PISMIDRAFT_302752 [Pisolithus microcarpus 441]|uniref:Uncharacterized protein n=1 Tax=Pisolithus microcarpus 441 TaxID=765257 RepID=A0A0D0A870_9AGAM|nr:hypothetical protein PISMIDRAFT_302752 [Pisolithus microcarpus 441]
MSTMRATRQIKCSGVPGFENMILVACHLNSSPTAKRESSRDVFKKFGVSTCHAGVEQVGCTCEHTCSCVPGAPKSKDSPATCTRAVPTLLCSGHVVLLSMPFYFVRRSFTDISFSVSSEPCH